MTTNFEMDGEQTPKPSSDPFMEPRTIPKNWDVSAFESPGTSSRDEPADKPDEPKAPDSTSIYEDDGAEANFDPFPQPRTGPGNWDVSDLILVKINCAHVPTHYSFIDDVTCALIYKLMITR